MSDESLFREVDEEVRQEQFKKLWDRYGSLIVAVCVLVIVGVAGFKGWQFWQLKQSEAAGQAFFEAVKLANTGKGDEALKQFEAIGHVGYKQLAELRAAAALADAGKADEAVKMFDAVAGNGSAAAPLRDLARIRAAYVLADSASVADLSARLSNLQDAGNPWRHAARDILLIANWRLKDYAAADAQVKAIMEDTESPPGTRQRARMIAELLTPLLAQK